MVDSSIDTNVFNEQEFDIKKELKKLGGTFHEFKSENKYS